MDGTVGTASQSFTNRTAQHLPLPGDICSEGHGGFHVWVCSPRGVVVVVVVVVVAVAVVVVVVVVVVS